MGFLDIFKRRVKEETPPDFSTAQAPKPAEGVASDHRPSPYGKDPLETSSPYDLAGQGGDAFQHDIFQEREPTGGQEARAYAQQFNPSPAPPSAAGQGRGAAGLLAGHESALILERLDTIKAELDAIKQRVMRVERFMEAAERKEGQRRYF